MDQNPTAQLNPAEMSTAMERLRAALAKQVGITLVQDANGSYGRAGTTYMTLRFLIEGRSYEASFTLEQLSCREADRALAAQLAEDK